MKNPINTAILLMTLAIACSGQEAFVSVSSNGKQKWSGDEVTKIYLSACNAVQREFGNRMVLRPSIGLLLGANKYAVDFDNKNIVPGVFTPVLVESESVPLAMLLDI